MQARCAKCASVDWWGYTRTRDADHKPGALEIFSAAQPGYYPSTRVRQRSVHFVTECKIRALRLETFPFRRYRPPLVVRRKNHRLQRTNAQDQSCVIDQALRLRGSGAALPAHRQA